MQCTGSLYFPKDIKRRNELIGKKCYASRKSAQEKYVELGTHTLKTSVRLKLYYDSRLPWQITIKMYKKRSPLLSLGLHQMVKLLTRTLTSKRMFICCPVAPSSENLFWRKLGRPILQTFLDFKNTENPMTDIQKMCIRAIHYKSVSIPWGHENLL